MGERLRSRLWQRVVLGLRRTGSHCCSLVERATPVSSLRRFNFLYICTSLILFKKMSVFDFSLVLVSGLGYVVSVLLTQELKTP